MTARARPGLPYALVLAAGLALGGLQYALDDRDPLVFTIPIVGLTLVILLVMWLSGRGDTASMQRVADEQGVRYDGVRPLPAVTGILRDVRAPAHVFAARLPDRGPRVRLAEVRGRRVAITEAPARDVHEEQDWLARHPLAPEAATEDGLLVVAVPRGTRYDELVALVGELHARLAG